MSITKIINDIKNSSGQETKLSRDSIIILFFRWLSFYVTPFFIIINISANIVTTFSLIFGLVSAILICFNYLFFGYAFYFIAVLLDHVDGNIARYKGESTFYGRFIDGFYGIVIASAMQVSFSVFAAGNSDYITLQWVGVLAAVFTPMHHLFYDRYSTFVRWIKEEGHEIQTKPYIRSNMSWSFYISDNIQKILLFLWPAFYYLKYSWELCLFTYFVLNIYLAINTLFKHTFAAKLHFKVSAKSHRS